MKRNINLSKFFILIIILSFSISSFSFLVNAENSYHGSYTYFNYSMMKKALKFYKDILAKGGWETINKKEGLNEGNYGDNVFLLKKRLVMTNDLNPKMINDPQYYDNDLKKAVIKFQVRHGLETTGNVNKETLEELNIPVEQRIKQIEYNIASMSNYTDKINNKYIIVNIPDFKLLIIEDNKVIMKMKTIVGTIGSKTPILNSKITYLVINPDWNIPYRSSVIVILPKIKNNPDYITKNNIKVFKGWGKNSTEMNPDTINWSKITINNFVYRFIQKAGPLNPMGLVKFKFPNSYNVALHGTPNDNLFNEKYRAFSAGCIRIEKEIELAKYIIGDMSSEEINKIIKNGKTKVVNLKKPIEIFWVYWTVWSTKDGTLHFRKDIYNKIK